MGDFSGSSSRSNSPIINHNFTTTSNNSNENNSNNLNNNNNGINNLNNQLQLNQEQIDRLKKLYPYTDIQDLPIKWSSKDKANFITLSEDGLKVHYKGVGKTHKDAAAVRATLPVPGSCLLYYYEVKIISKGRDGYMGIGLAAGNVNMHRLPGWDKQSYGYHGDDGHSFNSSGTGQQYGPTFTTEDIIGCGYNLIENTCFYTKNGLNLGLAFVDLPQVPLFPTVGLQTPGEELEANFGQKPFVYDIEQDLIKLRKKITTTINLCPVNHPEWQPMIHNLVQSWLIHNGYCSTAQVFSKYAKLPFKQDDIPDIKQRLLIQKLVLSGKIGEAIATTQKLYPKVLLEDPDLLFQLKCRQFIEFVCGNDDYINVNNNNNTTNSNNQNGSIVDLIQNGDSTTTTGVVDNMKMELDDDDVDDNNHNNNNNHVHDDEDLDDVELSNNDNEQDQSTIITHNSTITTLNSNLIINGGNVGASSSSSNSNNTNNTNDNEDDHIKRLKLILMFGKELNSLAQKLAAASADSSSNNNSSTTSDGNQTEINKKMLEEAWFSIAFADPKEAIGYLNHLDRETVCQRLNNAIVNFSNNNNNSSSSSSSNSDSGSKQSSIRNKVAIETVIKHTKALVALNNHCGAWILDQV